MLELAQEGLLPRACWPAIRDGAMMCIIGAEAAGDSSTKVGICYDGWFPKLQVVCHVLSVDLGLSSQNWITPKLPDVIMEHVQNRGEKALAS
jgi:hypothetical protein